MLPSDDLGPYFRTPQEKELTRNAIAWGDAQFGGGLRKRYWDDLLAHVGLRSDPTRKNPFQ